ncbi:MAG: HEAT repeat domain-containing protein, partial [Deltaproteobacteria bacterium]|nr:HEAT repeat domain-containing protein [Deltaproteobacteria bacterium]
WAMGRVALDRPDLVEEAGDLVLGCLDDPEAGVRGTACWCLERMPWVKAEDEITRLMKDQGRFLWYENDMLVSKKVSQMAQAALESRQA